MTDIQTPTRPMASSGVAPAKPLTPVNPVPLPDEAAGIEAIATLARAGEFAHIQMVETEGLGAGLPPRVPLLFTPGRDGGVKPIAQAIEAYRQGPARIVGTAAATTLQSFIDLVERHANGDSAVVRIPARLRYRVANNAVAWHYNLFRADHWLREQVTRDLARVAEATGLPCYQGSPEA